MSLKNLLLNLFFPKECFGCKTSNTWLCPKCLTKIEKYNGERPRALNQAKDLIIAGNYQDNVLKNLVTAFKFGFNQELALPLFIFLKTAIDQKIMIDNLTGRFWTNVLVIPIPLHKKRYKWRGFNQSKLIAQEVCNHYDFKLSSDLVRIKQTKNQIELKEEARLKNIQDIFKWTGKNLTNKTILLIDDVITSGATISEAEKVLKQAGSIRVIKIAIAKG